MRVDVVGFQEVFRRDALRTALMKSRQLGGVEPIVFATNENQNPASTPAVALATRLDVLQSESIASIPETARLGFPRDLAAAPSEADVANTVDLAITRFSRPVLKAQLRVTPTFTMTVFVTHLKSKRPTYLAGESAADPIHRALGAARSLVIRAAESAGLRALVVSEIKGNRKPVIVIGDVNDGALAVTTQMISGEPPFYRLSTERKRPFWDVQLYTAERLQARSSARDAYFTHIFKGKFEALDHIMVSEEFYNRNPNRVGEVDYVRVFNDHLIDETESFEAVPRTRSDHGQVTVKIELK